MPLIIIISTAISCVLLFLTVVILLKNNTEIYLKSLLSLCVLFFILKFVDLLSFFINPASFYLYFGIFFKDFHQFSLIILISIFPILLINLIRDKRNTRVLISITTFLTLLTYLTFFFESSFFKIIYIIHCILASIISIRILIFKRQKYYDYNIFNFLSFIFTITIFFMLFSAFYLFSVNKMFDSNTYIINTISGFSGQGYHKLVLNLCLIYFSLYILLNEKILHGKYYYESTNNIKNYKNHWNNVVIRKIEKKDLKLYEYIQTKIYKLVLDLNKLEIRYINNEVIFSSIEEISQLINQRAIDVDFVFKYNNYLTFKKYMLKINMLKAAMLIKKGFLKSNSVTDLAKLFGYSSRSAFFTKFKETNGYSPSRYT